MRDKFNNGEWTRARFNSFVKSALRSASRRWPAKYQTLNDSCVGQRINIKTNRIAKHYTCNCCKQIFPAKEVQVDHISAIIDPEIGFVNWDTIIDNMFCEKENLQVLCIPCHKLKTAVEKQQAKERKLNNAN